MPQPWTTKYAPEELDDMILAEPKKETLRKILQEEQNTMLYGKPGTGKSCFMRILKKEPKVNVLKINASFDNGIEMVRGKLSKYTRAFSPSEMKIVHFEEADKLTEEAQNALKDLTENVNKITKFFFVCNDPKNIIYPIKSRCVYQLTLDDPPFKKLYSYISNIIEMENVSSFKKDIEHVINDNYPDIRSMIGFIESNIIDNKLAISNTLEADVEKIRKLEKRRKSDSERYKKWKEAQTQAGRKQISAMISKEAYDILKSINGKSQSQVIEDLLLNYNDKQNQN